MISDASKMRPEDFTMHTRQLGNSDLHITPIGFGAWAIGGGGWAFAWGPQDDADSIAAIREASTSASTGSTPPRSTGSATPRRSSPRRWRAWRSGRMCSPSAAASGTSNGQIGKSLKAASIRAECEASLKRLKVDVIDLYQMHWPEPEEDIEEGWQTMLKLKEEGKVRWVGVSNFSAEQMAQVAKFGPITSLQPPYSTDPPRGGSEHPAVLPGEQHRRDRVLADGHRPAHGEDDPRADRGTARLTTGGRRRTEHYQEPLLTRNLNLVELLKAIGSRHGRTPARWRSRGCCGTRR